MFNGKCLQTTNFTGTYIQDDESVATKSVLKQYYTFLFKNY